MKRLTKIIDGGVVFPRELVGIALTPDNDYMHKLLKRLAAYEDTGLTPEKVAEYQHLCETYVEAGLDSKFVQFCIDATQNGLSLEGLCKLAQAEQDGRLIALPYKTGDLVYRIAVRKKYINRSMCTPYIKVIKITTENAHKYKDEIGKTVFLTREEAEVALKKREED